MLKTVLRSWHSTVTGVRNAAVRSNALLIVRPGLRLNPSLVPRGTTTTRQLAYLRIPSMFSVPRVTEYSGDLVNGVRHGQGTAKYSDGSSYKGTFENDKRSGYGREVAANGTVYEGNWAHGCKDGVGTIIYQNARSDRTEFDHTPSATSLVGTSYKGEWRNGLHHGSGTLTHANGSTYTGEFQQGFKHGWGKYVDHDGTFEGVYVIGQPTTGTLRYHSGNIYEGPFKDNKPHGYGKHIRESTKEIYEGQFVCGRQHGAGRITYTNGAHFEGTFVHNQVESGRGTYVFANKDVFVGEIVGGVMHGKGTLTQPESSTVSTGTWNYGVKQGPFSICNTYAKHTFTGVYIDDRIDSGEGTVKLDNGAVYTGIWTDGKRHGEGVLALHNGSVLSGVFVDNKLHGHGTCTLPSGKVLQGLWEHGELVEPSGEGGTGKGKLRISNKKFPDGSTYTGQTLDGLKHGHGAYTSSDGSIYVGEYVHDVSQGHGTLTYSTGAVYCGEFEGGQPQGFGTLTDELGVCEGEWINGKQNGVCTYTRFRKASAGAGADVNSDVTDEGVVNTSVSGDISHKSIDNTSATPHDARSTTTSTSMSVPTTTGLVKYVYQGQYVDGYKQGHGTTTYTLGKHVGQYAQGYAEGPGVMHYDNNDVYEGEFKRGLPHNQGKHTSADGTVYMGSWHKGRKHGKCSITYPDNATFVGEYRYNEPHTGTGRCVYTNNDVFEGTVKLGAFVGTGTYTHNNSVYIGTWLHGDMHGQFFITWHTGAILRAVYEHGSLLSGKGVLYKDGDKIVGQWAKKKMHGRCKITDAQGVVHEGEFKLGQRHGPWTTTHPDGSVEHSAWVGDRIKLDQASAQPEPAVATESVAVQAQVQVQEEMGAAPDPSHSTSRSSDSVYAGQTNPSPTAALSDSHRSDIDAELSHDPSYDPSTPAGSDSSGPTSPPEPATETSTEAPSKTKPHKDPNAPVVSGVQFYSYADGTAYHGTLRKGLKHGFGVFLTADGHRIEGQWREGRPHENMSVLYTNGDSYTGCLVRYLRHGPGVLTTAATGVKYDGMWWKGQRHGLGSLIGPKNELFVGEFRHNEPFSGEGTYIYHNGDTYTGQFAQGQRNGHGIYTTAIPVENTTECLWVNGDQEGEVTITYPSGRFHGTYAKGRMISGSGVYYFANGDRYDGVFVQGRKHGPGRYIDKRNGTVYDGEWVDGRREGYGLYKTHDGLKYEGEWKNGMKQGRGVLYRNNEFVYDGLWDKNRRVS